MGRLLEWQSQHDPVFPARTIAYWMCMKSKTVFLLIRKEFKTILVEVLPWLGFSICSFMWHISHLTLTAPPPPQSYFTFDKQNPLSPLIYSPSKDWSTGDKHRVSKLDISFTVWSHLNPKERSVTMSWVSVLRQSCPREK